MKEKMERWRFNNRNTKGKRIFFHQNPPKAAQDASKNRQRKEHFFPFVHTSFDAHFFFACCRLRLSVFAFPLFHFFFHIACLTCNNIWGKPSKKAGFFVFWLPCFFIIFKERKSCTPRTMLSAEFRNRNNFDSQKRKKKKVCFPVGSFVEKAAKWRFHFAW